jgi:hypothetical protein
MVLYPEKSVAEGARRTDPVAGMVADEVVTRYGYGSVWWTGQQQLRQRESECASMKLNSQEARKARGDGGNE